MCGRFTLTKPGEAIASLFPDADFAFELPVAARYNIAPSQNIITCKFEADVAKLTWMRWGLVPPWAKNPAKGQINARSETAHEKPTFRSAFAARRCLIPADGYYEWEGSAGSTRKLPHHITRADKQPFAFAAIWDHFKGDDKNLVAGFTSCAILTTDACKQLEVLHDRMPVILEKDQFEEWLQPTPNPATDLAHLLKPREDLEFDYQLVSDYVNNARHEGPACLAKERTIFD